MLLFSSFQILYQEMNSVEEMFVDVPGNTSSQGTITGLRGYTDYSIKVLAYTRIGDGDASSAFTDTTREAGTSVRIASLLILGNVIK